MLLRVLEDQVRDLEIKQLPQRSPDATVWINLLGDILHGRHHDSDDVVKGARRNCRRLADALEEEDEMPGVVSGLRNDTVPAPLRLAEALCALMGYKNQEGNYAKALEACLMTDRPNGLRT